MTGRSRIGRTALLAAAVWILLPSGARGGDGFHRSMLRLSEALRELERAVDRSDRTGVARAADALVAGAREAADLGPSDAGDRGAFELLRSRLAGQAGELGQLAPRAAVSRLSAGLAEIRHTCVTCHVHLRSVGRRHVVFPSRGGVVAGRILRTDRKGAPRGDHAGAVVFLEGPQLPRRRYPVRPVAVSQKERSFAPRVLAVVRGSSVEFPNDDTIFHNVFSLSRAHPLDLGIYPPGTSKAETFDDTGLVRLHCNIHPDMVAHLLVLENDSFVITDEQGRYTLSDVPAGNHRLRVWGEFADEIRDEITVEAGQLHERDFTLQENRRFVQHPNKFGRPYRSKY